MRYKILILSFIFPLILQAELLWKPHSVLNTGKWYQIGTVKAGLYKITYEDFMAMGFDPATINPANIQVFGNGGGILPENTSGKRTDDLLENSIIICGGDDGTFDPGDYVVFYGESPWKWSYDSDKDLFVRQNNYYSDTCYYFVTIGSVPGKRVTDMASLTSNPTNYSIRFRDYAFHDNDSLNLIKSGKIWVGEHFTTNDNHTFHLYFPGIDSLSRMKATFHLLAKSSAISNFKITDAFNFNKLVEIPATDPLQSYYCRENTKSLSIYPAHVYTDIRIDYLPVVPASEGWLDYFTLDFSRNNNWIGPQMAFRDPTVIGDECVEFTMKNVNPDVEIWNITFKNNIRRIIPLRKDSIIKFRMSSDTLEEYIAFDRSFFYPVKLVAPVANQDLHDDDPAELIIVTPAIFKAEAERLAAFHRENDLMSVLVKSVDDIYREFGSGNHDPAAIRDYCSMLFTKSDGKLPRYLLLFGDGTYDPKNRLPGNNNFISAFQSYESTNPNLTFLSDDFYGIVGHGKGSEADGALDLGVGRFPVSTPEDAKLIVDKVIRYSQKNDSVFGEWRNRFAFIADDENLNMHFYQTEMLSDIVKEKYPQVNINKIYNDAYKMVQTPAGPRLPDVNNALNKAIAEGTLVINYFGHGGEDGLAAEKILTIPDIQSWTNYNKLPVFITATCEFSRFDNPERFTAGEMVLMQPNGGAVALLSTTRLSYAPPNFRLDTTFFSHLLPDTCEQPSLGDLVRIAKNEINNLDRCKNFVLLGDPALKISFPKKNVISFQVTSTSCGNDTLTGLATVNVAGKLTDTTGSDLHIDGKLKTVIFDKPVLNYTLGNTSESFPAPFYSQNSVIYKGECNVVNGTFSFSFIVPKGINTSYGKGKISWYFSNGNTDAWGKNNDIVIGGIDPAINPLTDGPDIDLYMDNFSFVSGGKTKPNTVLLANIRDNEGINVIGLGIGHDLTLTLDDDQAHSYIMNDGFIYDAGSWQSGSFSLPFTDLSQGKHEIKVEAWDLYNNHSEKTISFWVSNLDQTVQNEAYCYPNPFNNFKTRTTFVVTNNGEHIPGIVKIMIYDRTGSLVSTLSRNYLSAQSGELKIEWDGSSDGGSRLNAGLYIYRVIFPVAGNNFSEVAGKILILN